MKLIRVTSFAVFLLFSLGSFTVNSANDEIISALRAGSSDKLAKSFASRVDLTLPDKSGSFSKSQAEIIMDDFFSSHKVKSFEVDHSGTGGGSNFIIGMLNTSNGRFRTTIFIKQRGDKAEIQGLQLESK